MLLRRYKAAISEAKKSGELYFLIDESSYPMKLTFQKI